MPVAGQRVHRQSERYSPHYRTHLPLHRVAKVVSASAKGLLCWSADKRKKIVWVAPGSIMSA